MDNYTANTSLFDDDKSYINRINVMDKINLNIINIELWDGYGSAEPS